MPSSSGNSEAEKQPSGLFGRLFSKGKNPIRAKLGDENKFVYNEKLKRWMMPGETVEEAAAASAPPPMSRVPSTSSVGSDADKRSDFSAPRGAAARYAAVGFNAPKPASADSSTSSAAFMPSPAKPPLGPPSKPAFFLPGANLEGIAGAPLAPAFFMPGASSASQTAAPLFSGYRSQPNPKRSPSGSQGVASEDDHDSKRSKAATPGSNSSSVAAGSIVTLAHGIADAPPTGSEVTLASGVGNVPAQTESVTVPQPFQGEESVGENTFGSTAANDAGEGVTSPGLKIDRISGGGEGADPEGGADAGASWADAAARPAAMGSGLQAKSPSEAAGTNAQGVISVEPSGDADIDSSAAPDRTDADWYKEMHFHYDASLQQGYSAAETEDWLRQGYPALMEGFLSWCQANKEGQAQDHAEQPSDGTAVELQPQEADPASAASDFRLAAFPPNTHIAGTVPPIEQSDAQENSGPFTNNQNGVHEQGSEGKGHGRMLSDVRSDVADQGSIISDRDEPHRSLPIGGRTSESTTASGKLTGPLPWDILDELSDDDDLSTTAGTPRFAWTLSNGEPALVDKTDPARPALAGAALAEAAEQAGGRIAGWVTNIVKSGAIQQAVQQHLPMSIANQSRFPRPPTDLRSIFQSHSPTSVQSGGTSMLNNAGTPSSIKSVPTDSQHFESQGMPHPAKASQSSRSAISSHIPAPIEEQALPEDPMEGIHTEHTAEATSASSGLPEPQQQMEIDQSQDEAFPERSDEPAKQPQQDSAAEDGWDFEDSALDGLGDAQPSQSQSKAGQAATAGSSSAIAIESKAEDAYGNGSVAGMSPPALGWDGESELNFPLDDVPKELTSAQSPHGKEMDLPEGGKLKKLVVPPATPLRALGSGLQPDSSAALHEAMAHGGMNEKLAALQKRLEEVSAMHQQAADESESLRDQNGALEMELSDVKGQLDRDILQTRELEEKLGVQRQMEDQFEEVMQELEDLRIKYDALKADNSTMLAERKRESASSPSDAAVVDANGNAGPHRAAEDSAAPLQGIAELEAELAQARSNRAAAEDRIAELEENVEQLMTDLDNSMQDVVSRDEEIDKLEARLAGTQDNAEKVAHLEKEANTANQEVVQLADEVEKRDALVEQLQEVLHALKQQLDCQGKASLQQQETLSAREERRRAVNCASREAELQQLQVQLEDAGANSGRITGLEAELTTAMAQAAAQALEAEGLKKELEGTQATAAHVQAEISVQLEAQQSLSQDAQQQIEALCQEVEILQETIASEQQARNKAESQLKTLQENAHLDFERIGALSEENAELKDKVEELTNGREAAASAELQALHAAQEAAHARLAEAEVSISTLASEKETFAKRGAKLQMRFNKLQADAIKKQEQAAAQLAELQQKLDEVLAASPTSDPLALQEALDKVTALEQRAAEAEARGAEASNRAEEAEGQLAAASIRAQEAELAAAEANSRAEEAEHQCAAAASLAEAQNAETAADAQRQTEEAEARAREASEQLEQAQACSQAAERHLSREIELRKSAEQRAAELEEAARSLEAHKAAQDIKVSELEEEASSLFERQSGLEEELGAVQAQSHAHEQALLAAQAEVQELRTRLAESPAAPAAAEAPQEPDDDLIAALGQESEKVEKLIALLQERGFDPTEILDEIEERFAGGDEAEDESAASHAAPTHAEGSEVPVVLHSNAAFDDSPGRDASHTEDHHGMSSTGSGALTEQPAVDAPQQDGFEGFENEVAHQPEGSSQPERHQQQAKESVSAFDGWGDESGHAAEKAIEGLPDGELLSPPQLPHGQPELAAQIEFGQAGADDNGWDNWDEDIGSSLA